MDPLVNDTLGTAIKFILAFIVLFNPFALYVYMQPVKKDLLPQTYRNVLIRASLISFFIYLFFSLSGNFVFENILNINFESFRIFGGIVIFTLSYLYIIEGRRSIIRVHEDINDMASEIAIPFFVGAGTISISILMGRAIGDPLITTLSLIIIIATNYVIIVGLGSIFDKLEPRLRSAFDKMMGIFIRLTGLLIGALGIDMVINGIRNVFF